MRVEWIKTPLISVSVHFVLLLLFLLFTFIQSPNEIGASWEVVFGTIDFLGYYIVSIPSYVATLGMDHSYIYFLWFALIGSIQWFFIGFLVFLIKKLGNKKRGK